MLYKIQSLVDKTSLSTINIAISPIQKKKYKICIGKKLISYCDISQLSCDIMRIHKPLMKSC